MSVLVYRGRSTMLFNDDVDRPRTITGYFRKSVRCSVPDNTIDLHRWLRVISKLGAEDDPAFPFRVVYRPTPEDLLASKVSIRVQGVYVVGQLSAAGDRGGHTNSYGLHDPLQWVWLTWGYVRFRDRFQAQIAHLRALVNVCFEQMRVIPPQRKDDFNGLYLRRRLCKKTDHAPDIPALKVAVLTRELDRKYFPVWTFFPGDLIEAIVCLDIEIRRGSDGIPRTSVYLSFNELVVLKERYIIEKTDGAVDLPNRRDIQDHRGPANIGWGGDA